MIRALLLAVILCLFAATAEATLRIASSIGAGSTCSLASPCSMATGASLTASPGDVLELRGGTYTDSNVPLGGSGTALNHIVIMSYQNEQVTFTGGNPFDWYSFAIEYIDFLGNAGNTTSCAVGTCTHNLIFDFHLGNGDRNITINLANYLTFVGIEVKNAVNISGIQTAGTGHIIRNSYIHHNGGVTIGGTPQDHGIYQGSSDTIIEGNEFTANCGAGIQAYSASDPHKNDNLIIRNNYVHDNNTCGPMHNIVIAAGSNMTVVNNIVARGLAAGITCYNIACNGAIFYGNTVYGHADRGLYLYPGPAATGTIWKNNISVGNGINKDFTAGTVTESNNITTGNATDIFNDPTNSIFTLKSGSAALDAGATLSSPFNVAIDGTSRPAGAAFDVGAFETLASTPSCDAVLPALVAEYSFDGTPNDTSGNGFTASLGSGWTYTTGKYGQGALSAGTSGITVADDAKLRPCGALTYELWISTPDTTGTYAAVVKNPDSSSFLFAAISGYCGSGRIMGGVSQGGGTLVCFGTAPLTNGTLTHIAYTYDASLGSANHSLYINGSLVTSQTGTALLDPTTGTLQFCTSGFGETCPSGTIIDEVRIYNYARSAGQIVTDMLTPVNSAPGTIWLTVGASASVIKLGAAASALKIQGQ